ncbi:MAG: Omp28-related outer membrane protein [Chitinophagaceae bacterium]|nr:Omp28-related outer membrane protein [Chitinophagaceae bacterium]HMN33409.1 Omp28-related outer membrane protein [Chitinophagaceae bacterium]
MKTRLTISIFSLFIFLAACNEQTPKGLVLNPLISTDTTYVINTIEAAQTKKVLIEELTGVRCPNCPQGTTMLNSFINQNPDRIIVAAIHSGFLTEPLQNSIYDFRNADADALRLSFPDGDPPKPSAAFDRMKIEGGANDGKYFVVKGAGSDWQNALTSRLSKQTPVNIHLNSNYNVTDNKVNIHVKLHFTDVVNEKLALTLYILENGKVDVQDSSSYELHDYEFNHVLVKSITAPVGEPILDTLSSIEKGRVLEKYTSFEPLIIGTNAWNIDKCMIVAIVHKTGTSKEVIHVEEVPLK